MTHSNKEVQLLVPAAHDIVTHTRTHTEEESEQRACSLFSLYSGCNMATVYIKMADGNQLSTAWAPA